MTLPRLDSVDALLAVWSMLIVVSADSVSLIPEANILIPSFPAATMFGPLFFLLLLRRFGLPATSRQVQLLAGCVLSIATASIFAVTATTNSTLRAIGTNLLYFLAWFLANEGARQALGLGFIRWLKGKQPLEGELERAVGMLIVPGTCAILATLAGVTIQMAWPGPSTSLLVMSFWIVPFGFNFVYLLRITSPVANHRLHQEKTWPCPFGPSLVVCATFAGVSVLGFALEFLLERHNYLAWALVILALLFQVLAILRLNKLVLAEDIEHGRDLVRTG